jgi:hypothetical protein
MPTSSSIFAVAFACCGILLAVCDDASAQTADQTTIAKSAEPRRISFVRENGVFQNKFDTLDEALEKSRGDKGNHLLRSETELISLDSRCDTSKAASFAMHRLVYMGIDIPVKAYFDFVATLPKGNNAANPERKKRERAMIDEILSTLSKTAFPRKAECDAIPILLSVGNYDSILLEISDAQNPLIGARVNDGTMYSDFTDGNEYVETFAAYVKDPDFVARYGYNRYGSAEDAVNAARLSSGDGKVVIFDGTKAVVYRLGDFKIDRTKSGAAFEAQFDVFKNAKIRKGWTILAVIADRDKAFKMNIPAAMKAKK